MLTTLILTVMTVVTAGATPASATRSAPIEATGVGYPPVRSAQSQARLMARRAAEVGAVRNLYREINPARPVQRVPFRYVSSVTRPDGSVVVRVSALPRQR